MLLEKATQFAIQMNCDFRLSLSWITRFKTRNGINFQKIHGEQNSTDPSIVEKWLSTVYPELAQNFSAENIYNADETGLFYKAVPTGTLNQKGENAFGVKTYKERITCLFIVNQTGTDKQKFVVGKNQKPQCFKNRNIQVPYYFN